MKYSVPKEIIGKTDCKFGFSCLETEMCDNHQLCDIIENFGLDVLFVEPIEKQYCGHKMNYGVSNICTCPVRAYLYYHYKI